MIAHYQGRYGSGSQRRYHWRKGSSAPLVLPQRLADGAGRLMRRPICRQLIIGTGRPRRFEQHGAMDPGDCGGRRMATKASHSRVRAGVPNPLAYATQGCAAGLHALVERSDALTIRDFESMRARRADLDEI